MLTRPYAPAVAGRPTLSLYDDKSGVFKLRYRVVPDVTSAITQIFKHKQYHYPSGYTVSISPAGVASWAATSDNFVEVTHDAAALARLDAAVEVEVVIRRM